MKKAKRKTKEKPLKIVVMPNENITEEESDRNLFSLFDFLLAKDVNSQNKTSKKIESQT